MKEVNADASLEINVECPCCDFWQNRLEDLREYYTSNELAQENVYAQLECENCKEVFMVKSINY